MEWFNRGLACIKQDEVPTRKGVADGYNPISVQTARVRSLFDRKTLHVVESNRFELGKPRTHLTRVAGSKLLLDNQLPEFFVVNRVNVAIYSRRLEMFLRDFLRRAEPVPHGEKSPGGTRERGA